MSHQFFALISQNRNTKFEMHISSKGEFCQKILFDDLKANSWPKSITFHGVY